MIVNRRVHGRTLTLPPSPAGQENRASPAPIVDLSTLIARAMVLSSLTPDLPATPGNRARLLAALKVLPE